MGFIRFHWGFLCPGDHVFLILFSNVFPLFVGAHAHALISLWKNDAWEISTEFLLSENTFLSIEFQLRNHFQSEALRPLSSRCLFIRMHVAVSSFSLCTGHAVGSFNQESRAPSVLRNVFVLYVSGRRL